jgi:protein subunit release factor B
MPEFPDLDEVELREDEYEFMAYHSSGAGGQNINKVSSAVRITHKATGIVAACQTERSQLQNTETAGQWKAMWLAVSSFSGHRGQLASSAVTMHLRRRTSRV